MAGAIRVCGAFFGALLDFGHQQNQPLALGGTTNWADEIDAHDCFIQVQVSHAKKNLPYIPLLIILAV